MNPESAELRRLVHPSIISDRGRMFETGPAKRPGLIWQDEKNPKNRQASRLHLRRDQS